MKTVIMLVLLYGQFMVHTVEVPTYSLIGYCKRTTDRETGEVNLSSADRYFRKHIGRVPDEIVCSYDTARMQPTDGPR